VSERIRLLTALIVGAALVSGCASTAPPGTPSPSWGVVQNRVVPDIPLVDQHGATRTLASFRGKVVILVPMLTLCQEVCPLTTENLLVMQQAIDNAGMGTRVAIVEYSIDPARDTPARLAAYEALTGARWTMLTGIPTDVTRLNQFLYVFADKVPEGSPVQTDWWTGQPLAYDVDHTDGYFLIDSGGHERFATSAAPDVTGHTLPRPLDGMLNNNGRQNLNDPALNGQTWTVPQALDTIGWLLRRRIPAPS
jgi:cytochrome oxidase Cu insertion factor (SCO1/SenC/PrrC family)